MATTKMEAVASVRLVVPFEADLVEFDPAQAEYEPGVDHAEQQNVIAEHGAAVEESRKAAAKQAEAEVVAQVEQALGAHGEVTSITIEEVREA